MEAVQLLTTSLLLQGCSPACTMSSHAILLRSRNKIQGILRQRFSNLYQLPLVSPRNYDKFDYKRRDKKHTVLGFSRSRRNLSLWAKNSHLHVQIKNNSVQPSKTDPVLLLAGVAASCRFPGAVTSACVVAYGQACDVLAMIIMRSTQ